MKVAKNNSPGVFWFLWREITFYHFQLRNARQSFSDIIAETKTVKLLYLMLMNPPVSVAPEVYSVKFASFLTDKIQKVGKLSALLHLIYHVSHLRSQELLWCVTVSISTTPNLCQAITHLSIQKTLWSSPKLDTRTSSVQHLHVVTCSYNAIDISFFSFCIYSSPKETWQLCYRSCQHIIDACFERTWKLFTLFRTWVLVHFCLLWSKIVLQKERRSSSTEKKKISLVNIFFLLSPTREKKKCSLGLTHFFFW